MKKKSEKKNRPSASIWNNQEVVHANQKRMNDLKELFGISMNKNFLGDIVYANQKRMDDFTEMLCRIMNKNFLRDIVHANQKRMGDFTELLCRSMNNYPHGGVVHANWNGCIVQQLSCISVYNNPLDMMFMLIEKKRMI